MIKLGMCGYTIGAAAYFRQFPVVEVQQTFYDPPPLLTMQKWRAQAPPSFEFTMKAWQVITHRSTSTTYRRMRRPFSARQLSEAGAFQLNETTLHAWDVTLEAQRALRATAILFQCPASFKATDENVEAMYAFVSAIERPTDVRLLWEPRGAWPDELVLKICRDLDMIHAVDPFVRPTVTPELQYWRLHGNKTHWANYTDEELQQIIDWLPRGTSPDTYVLFNNIPRVKDIKRYRELLEQPLL